MLIRLINAAAGVLGYVPAARMEAALKAQGEVEQELRHKTRNLEQQILYRDRLEREVAFLRELQLLHARKESPTQQAVARLDLISDKLLEMMKTVWPEAYDLETLAEGTAADAP